MAGRVTGIEERFWSKVDTTGDCWEWKGAIFKTGYGAFHLNGKTVRAHRVAFEMDFGAIPAGLHLDHICRNRACVRPLHLEAVTQKENNRRRAALVTECPQGHPYDESNTHFRKSGKRECLTCCRERMRRYRVARKDLA